ncbi:MAG TPA: alpha-galactosidase, partial [Chitinophagaceae bacterium]|nr:alpha-galactosidase [Chitinophagaceae bacterium]
NEAGIYNNAYSTAGTYSLTEPAMQVTHADGNASLDLKYISHDIKNIDANTTLTSILLQDSVYPFKVTLFYKVWKNENVTEQWAEITHSEKNAVVLQKFASANLYFASKDFYLTTFQGQYAREMQPAETRLEQGMRSIDSKLGTRAMLVQSPNFIISFGKPASETEGNVMLGQLAWSGNFKLEFEIDSYHNLRFIAGINPFAAAYTLQPGKVFKTPSLVYTFSSHGKGEASRNLHDWARKYRVLDGMGERLTLLNNWEATYFDFDENKITSLFKGAAKLGVDMFLLDDGWFGNKYPRNGDQAGLGDWQENAKKLPHGLGYLVAAAQKENIKFGIWIEPEMVNPKSELYEKHPDWVIKQPERPEIYFRNQLVLDLSNPQVQHFVYTIVDSLFIKNPGLAFIKWDCNAPVFNSYSAYLQKQKLPQSHLSTEYVRGLYSVLEKIRTKYPSVPMMLCSGGGGRGDYEMLKYFTEFWPSDDTEPVERIFMQWDYSYFFPSITTDNHVTDWGKQPIKFRVDVASMGKLGFDIVAGNLNEQDMAFCQQAVKNYNSFKHTVWQGDLYRLLNPHENRLASLMYVSKDQNTAVMFNLLVNTRVAITATELPVQLAGLDAGKKYHVKEINLYPGTSSPVDENKIYSGDFLMKVGINPHVNDRRQSVVLEINEAK